MQPAFDAVIFDLDGVLVDSEIWWDEVRAAFAATHGRAWLVADRAAVMGANSPTWSRTMRERLGLDLAASEIESEVVGAMVERYRREGPPVIEGAVEAVRRIAERLPVAVASSAHPAVIGAALDATGLSGAFAAIASSDEVPRGKPAPDVYRLAAERLGVAPARCLVVEDTLNGIRAAQAAGMRAVLVPNRSIPPAEGAAELADLTISRLADLDPLVLDLDALRPAPRAAPSRPARASVPASASKESRLPASHLPAWRRALRYYLSRLLASALVRTYLRVRVEHAERFAAAPAVYCFNHLSWLDPFVLMAALPLRPRLYFFGPKEEDMQNGGRNRLISWTGSAVPYKPGKNDLLGATRRVEAVFSAGGVLAIAGEGGIHVGEALVDPLSDGPAYFALRAGVPVIPLAINGTSWVSFGRTVRVRVGEPVLAAERPTTQSVAAMTRRLQAAMAELVADAQERPRPGWPGRWISERFNDWGPGGRPALPERPTGGGRSEPPGGE